MLTFTGVDELFWYCTIIGLALGIIPFGLPYIQAVADARLSEQGRVFMRSLPKFLAALSILSLVVAVFAGVILTSKVAEWFSEALGLTKVMRADLASALAVLLFIILLIGGIWLLWRLWRWTANRLPDVPSDAEKTLEAIRSLRQQIADGNTTLASRVDTTNAKLDELISEIRKWRDASDNPQ